MKTKTECGKYWFSVAIYDTIPRLGLRSFETSLYPNVLSFQRTKEHHNHSPQYIRKVHTHMQVLTESPATIEISTETQINKTARICFPRKRTVLTQIHQKYI